MEKLILPCTTGKFGSWRYFNVLMKIKYLVGYVKTVPQSKKIYRSENLNEILQRLENPKRIAPIKNYILKQKDRYFNSLTVAFSGGDPKWYAVSLKKDLKFDSDTLEYLNLKYGVLELNGKEELFILDGQHRLLGLREAYQEDESIGDEEISIMLVVHQETQEGIKRTRRLFVSLNRNAKPVSEGENIILEEDDVSAIVARQLVEHYNLFKTANVIAFNKNLNLKIGAQDKHKFTSILALYSINEIIFDNEKLYDKKISGKYVRIRPEEKIIKSCYQQAEAFWDLYFSVFKKAKKFVRNPSVNLDLRTKNGGKFYLRPVGQEIIARFYDYLAKNGESSKFKSLTKLEENLKSDFWNYVLFNPHKETILMSKGKAFNYILYNFGFPLSNNQLKNLKDSYLKNSGDLKLRLPSPKFVT
jgi:DNA sulfur modification protein DndB